MNLQDLRYAVAVDDHRHFGRAAEACFVSQPTLSSQLRKLEDELGVALFERAPRNVMPTAVGGLILPNAGGVLVEADQTEALAKAAAEPGAATLQIGVFPTLAPYLLPHVVGPLHERFPLVELLWVEEKTEQVVEGLLGGHLDAGLLALPIDAPQLHQEPLFTEDFVLAVPADHELADATSVAPEVLAGADVLLLTDGHCLRDQALEVCSMAGAAERHGFRATSLETLRQMVAAGVGVTLLPKMSVSPPVTQSDHVRTVPFDSPAPNRQIAMFWRRSSVHAGLLPQLAAVIADLPDQLLRG